MKRLLCSPKTVKHEYFEFQFLLERFLLELVWERIVAESRNRREFEEFGGGGESGGWWKTSEGELKTKFVTWRPLELPCPWCKIIHLEEPDENGIRKVMKSCPLGLD